ncbi:MAG: hypothetical protein ACK523_20735 [Pirellulaceae bacterium]
MPHRRGSFPKWDSKNNGMRKTAGSLASWTAESYRYESVATSTTGRDTNIQQNQREGKRMAETYDLAIVGGGIVGLAT